MQQVYMHIVAQTELIIHLQDADTHHYRIYEMHIYLIACFETDIMLVLTIVAVCR